MLHADALHKSASAPLFGPPEGPLPGRHPPRPPLNPATCGANLFYDLPPVDVVQKREVRNIRLGGPEGPSSGGKLAHDAPLAAPTEGADVFYEVTPLDNFKQRTTFECTLKGAHTPPRDSLTQKAYLNFDGELTHPVVYKPGVKKNLVFFGSQEQRPDASAVDLTQSSYAAQRDICTPGAHKHTRAPARRFGPGPGLSFHERFRSSNTDLTRTTFLKDTPSASEPFVRRRNPSAFMGSRSTRSAIMDGRMEQRANAELRLQFNF